MRHSTIQHNGTGVSISDAASVLSENSISNNYDAGMAGWGIVVGNRKPILTENTITGNGVGGGIYLQGGAILNNNTITNNTGYAVQIVLAAVKDCQLADNVFTGNGHDAVGIVGGSSDGDHVWAVGSVTSTWTSSVN